MRRDLCPAPNPPGKSLCFSALREREKEAGGGRTGWQGTAQTLVITASLETRLTGAALAGPAANERRAGCCRQGHECALRSPPSPLLDIQTCHPVLLPHTWVFMTGV